MSAPATQLAVRGASRGSCPPAGRPLGDPGFEKRSDCVRAQSRQTCEHRAPSRLRCGPWVLRPGRKGRCVDPAMVSHRWAGRDWSGSSWTAVGLRPLPQALV
ncbi:hypothetical protein AAFF_G00044200 [Aldrovandia affinis]|uniref:Uncharacterized protein n=1 Tax=Aldrovandia affinis TaxID=143900 RepID=A0AAD7WF10_9TELE|nr:hypothetical protein AAFF_G00044200 [Aldrovandia affinis]